METKSQRDKILGLLVSARGQWIGLPEIAACAMQYNSRIHELRRLGFVIENKIRVVDGVKHSSFRLVAGTAMRQVAKPHAPENFYRPVRPVQQALFSDRHQDE